MTRYSEFSFQNVVSRRGVNAVDEIRRGAVQADIVVLKEWSRGIQSCLFQERSLKFETDVMELMKL